MELFMTTWAPFSMNKGIEIDTHCQLGGYLWANRPICYVRHGQSLWRTASLADGHCPGGSVIPRQTTLPPSDAWSEKSTETVVQDPLAEEVDCVSGARIVDLESVKVRTFALKKHGYRSFH